MPGVAGVLCRFVYVSVCLYICYISSGVMVHLCNLLLPILGGSNHILGMDEKYIQPC